MNDRGTERRQGVRYLSDGGVWEWADGCVSIPVRAMDARELSAWNYALLLTTIITDRDRAEDRLCEIANNSEDASLRAEQRGDHDEASWQWLRSELFDAAAKGLVK